MNYEEYVAVFNSGDDDALVKRFYTEDCLFSNGEFKKTGHAELLGFLRVAHDGIREILRPQVVLRDESHIVAEVDIDFHATADRPNFVFGALKNGESTTVKFFAIYYLRDGKVAHLKASKWRPNVGVSKPSLRLGGSPEQREAYLAYARAFSDADIDGFTKFYTDDVRCELPTMVLEGREAIASFYREMFKTMREQITVHQFIADDKGIALDATAKFIAIEDAPNFPIAPLKKGESISGRRFVYYTLSDGRIATIRAARVGAMTAPAKNE